MDTSIDIIGNLMIIAMDKELDHHNAQIVKNMADKYILQGNIKNIVFDFEDTDFMDSSGIGVIAGRYKNIKPFNGKVYVINVNKNIDRILLLSGLYKLVERVDNLEQII